jgi:6-phosphogluconate dehydrogenase
MKIGLIGLGKMGYNLALNAISKKHEVVAFDLSDKTREMASNEGIQTVPELPALIKALPEKKVIWLMVPAGDPVDGVIKTISPLLTKNDIIIDGGNSHFKDSMRRGADLAKLGIAYLDCGTSGGISGARDGICAMVGGDASAFGYVEPLFRDIAVDQGYLYCGAPGSGHFAKMVHNGIEYGMMQAIAEGFELLQHSGFTYNFENVSRMWNHGSVIRGWLMELCQNAFSKDPQLDGIKGIMHSSGEGRWMLETALEKNIATPVVALSFLMRYRSLQTDNISGKVVAALRNEFGGHAVEAATPAKP